MKISKVKLRNEGLKGLQITWERYETKNGVSFRIESTDKRNAPVHKELLDCFEWLEKYLLISLDKEQGTVDVTGIEVKNDGYIMLGLLHTSTGVFNIKSPVLDHTNLDRFQEVENIIKGLMSELKEYMDGNKGMSVDEYVKKVNKGNEDFNENEFQEMNSEQKINVYVSLIEKAGGVVIMPDDLQIENEPIVEKPVLKMVKTGTPKKETTFKQNESDSVLFEINPEKIIASTKKIEPQENNNFLEFDL